MSTEHNGSCFCGAIEFQTNGEPSAMGYCHCSDCRSWAAAPVHTFSVWDLDKVDITKGEEHLKSYKKSDFSVRKFCGICGGHILVEHPTLAAIDIPVSKLPTLKFEPGLHVNYPSTVFPIKDGLPKLNDFPEEFGGTGEVVSE